MTKGWNLSMTNNKALKFYSLALSSMIFSSSALSPVYAGRYRTKKKIFSDPYSLKQRLKSEDQSVKTGGKSKDLILSNTPPYEELENFREKSEIATPLGVYLCEICEKLENLENEIYNKEIFKKVKVSKNLFDVDLCTGFSFRGYNSYYDVKYFKNRVRKLYGKPFDDNRPIPINVLAYFHAMYLLGKLDNINRDNKLTKLKLWQENGMTEKMNMLVERTNRLDNLVHKDETNLVFKFHCHVESVIEALFKVRLFYETLAATGGISCINDLDTAIASFWYVDQTIVR